VVLENGAERAVGGEGFAGTALLALGRGFDGRFAVSTSHEWYSNGLEEIR